MPFCPFYGSVPSAKQALLFNASLKLRDFFPQPHSYCGRERSVQADTQLIRDRGHFEQPGSNH